MLKPRKSELVFFRASIVSCFCSKLDIYAASCHEVESDPCRLHYQLSMGLDAHNQNKAGKFSSFQTGLNFIERCMN